MTYYYRLRQVDYDGQFEYSPVVVATIDHLEQDVISLYPNPNSTGLLFLNLTSTSRHTQNIQIRDIAGRLVYQADFELESGSNQLEIDVSTLNQGLYILEVDGAYRKFLME